MVAVSFYGTKRCICSVFFFFVSGETEQLKDGKLFPVVYFVCVLITWWFRLEIGDWRLEIGDSSTNHLIAKNFLVRDMTAKTNQTRLASGDGDV